MSEAALSAVAAAMILVTVIGQARLLARTQGFGLLAPVTASVSAPEPAPGDGGRSPRPVLDLLRRHRWARRGLSLGSLLAVVAAFAVLGYPFFTNLQQARIQSRLDHQLVSPPLRQAYLEHRIADGDSLTRIRIPSIDVDVVVVEGTTADALRAGAGHYRSTPLPCETGNVAIAGHRTTYGRPFANLDLLRPGDEIKLDTPVGSCVYKVSAPASGRSALDDHGAAFVVEPDDLGVLAPSPVPTLTLTTCHPKGSAAKRLVVQATMAGAPTPTASATG